MGRLAGSGPEPGSWPVPSRTEATITSGGAGAACRSQASRSAARTASAVNGSPPSTHAPRWEQPGAGVPPRRSFRPRLRPARGGCRRARLATSRAGELRWPSDRAAARDRRIAACRRPRPAFPDRRGPRSTPIAAAARDVSSRSSACQSMPLSSSSERPSAARSCKTASGAAAAIRSASSGLAMTCMRPPTMPRRNGSRIAIGSSWRMAAERSVSP